MDKEKKLLECVCPFCGYEINTLISMKKKKSIPKVGDYTICGNCFEFGEYDENFSVKKLDRDKTNPEVLNKMNEIVVKIKEIKDLKIDE